MSYQEKKNVLNIFSTLLISGIYFFWYVWGSRPEETASTDELLRFWATSMLVLIPVSIVAKIIVHIFFAIGNAVATQEKEHDVPRDERDKAIELKANQVSTYVFGAGFILAMAAIAYGMSVTAMFIIFICGGVFSEVLGNITQIYYYRRGM